jgi:ribose/xylose/arabinose/galactoside ABC-type transport system permease subunit
MALGGALGAGLLGTAYGAANPIHLPFSAAFLVALLISGAIGFLNGWAITTLNMTPFVVTLGMMTLVRGLTYIYTDFTVRAIPGSPITYSDPGFDWLGSGNLGFLPTQTLIFLVLALMMALMTRFTPFGRDVYAIGGNLEIARLAGINTGRVIIGAYTIMAMLAGLSGIMLAGRLSSVAPSMATGYELNVITIVVVGGASLAGGRGSILGTVLGAFMITMIDSGLDLLNVPSFYQYLVRGTVLLAAVIIDKWCRGRQMASATG